VNPASGSPDFQPQVPEYTTELNGFVDELKEFTTSVAVIGGSATRPICKVGVAEGVMLSARQAVKIDGSQYSIKEHIQALPHVDKSGTPPQAPPPKVSPSLCVRAVEALHYTTEFMKAVGFSLLNQATDPTVVTIAGSNGWAVQDLDSAIADRGPLAGSEILVAGFVSYGPGGFGVTAWDLEAGDIGGTFSPPGGHVTDGWPYGNDPFSGGVVVVDNQQARVIFIERSSFEISPGEFSHRLFPVDEQQLDASHFAGATGNPITAFRKVKGGPVLVVTDGQPGQLWKHSDPGAPGVRAELIGTVGNDPRRVRCAGNIAVVSNFGSDSLTIVRITDTGCEIVGTVNVGDGPVGIDVIELGTLAQGTGSNVAVVSTGFFDDTYWITVIDAAGTVLSNEGSPVPDGCRSPGHAIWLPDRSVAISCNATDNVAIVASVLPQG
jgi:hypothetical protein